MVNDEKNLKKSKELNLKHLKTFLKMIEKGATGFDLAYEVDKQHLKNSLIHDGIVFYKTFLNIGNQQFKDVPDKLKTSYTPFKLVEDSEKGIFMKWLKTSIKNHEKPLQLKKDYAKYLAKKVKNFEPNTECKKCGAIIKEKNQKICERCGFKLN